MSLNLSSVVRSRRFEVRKGCQVVLERSCPCLQLVSSSLTPHARRRRLNTSCADILVRQRRRCGSNIGTQSLRPTYCRCQEPSACFRWPRLATVEENRMHDCVFDLSCMDMPPTFHAAGIRNGTNLLQKDITGGADEDTIVQSFKFK